MESFTATARWANHPLDELYGDQMVTVNDLKKVLAADGLSPKARETGQELLTRLNSPVRVAILGLPKSGKSQLFNMILGKDIIPVDANLPTLEIRKSTEDRTTLTLADGKVESFEGISLDNVSILAPAFVQLESDSIPALEKISLLEVVAGISYEEQARAVRWASRRADILLWCSQSFSTAEQAIWATVPDDLKDQSSMVLTKADILSKRGVLNQQIDALRDIVADNFNSFLPVATLQAIASKSVEGGDEIFTSSGGKAVVLSILRQVQMSRRADMALVERYVAQNGAAPAPKPVASPTAVQKPATKDTKVEIAKLDTKAAPKTPEPALADKSAEQTVCANLLEYVTDRMSKLDADLPDFSSDDLVRNVIEHSLETIDSLNEKMTEALDDNPGLEQISERILDASDIMLLLQFEEEETAATDAAILTLQLSRELRIGAAA